MIPAVETEVDNLWSAATLVALKEVSITGKLAGRIADVTITQKYINKNKNAKSVVFKFPFPEELGTVSSFSVKIDKAAPLKADVKDNKLQLVTDMQGALSAEFNSTEDTRELLVCRVVALEPGKEVSISVSFVATAVVSEPEHLRFTLPTDLAFSLEDDEQPHDLNVKLDLEMHSEVKLITSPTHTLQSTIDSKDKFKANCGCTLKDWTENEDLVILVSTPQSTTCQFTPGYILKPDYIGYVSFMFSFVPDLRNLTPIPNVDFVFLIDCSDLMAGENRAHASAAVEQFIKRLPLGATFNLISVGTTDKRLFKESAATGEPAQVTKALSWLKGLESDAINCIAINGVLTNVLIAALPKGTVGRQVVLITCGAISDASTAMLTLREHVNKARLLVLGVAERASHHLLHSLARAGHGVAEILSGKESVEKKVERHVHRALQPRVADLRLDWGTMDKLLKQPLLVAPAAMGHLYDGEAFVVFVFAELNGNASISKTEEYTVTLKANSPAGPLTFPALVKHDKSHLPGVLIHKLASAAIIREAENNAIALPADRILLLSTNMQLSSTATSFVALAEKAADKPAATALLSYRFPPEVEEGFDEEDRPVTPQLNAVAPGVPAAAGKGMPMPMPMPRPRSPNPAAGGRLQYDAAFLISFQSMCTDRPSDMPSFDSILSSTARKPPSRAGDRSGEKKGRATGGFAGKGSSGGGGGRGGRSAKAAAAPAPSGPLPTLRQAENRWQRPARAGAEAAQVDATLLKARGVLNKLTRDNFEQLAQQLEEMSTSHTDVLKGLIDRIFDKAVGEPKFCAMYAELCVRLNKHVLQKETPEGEQPNLLNSRFRRLLLGKCQQEFETKATKTTTAPAAAGATGTVPSTEGTAAAPATTGDSAPPTATTAETPAPVNTPSAASTIAETPAANSATDVSAATEPIANGVPATKKDEKASGNEAPLTPEELEVKHKRRVIGNIKFIGELFKLGMLKPIIMHECVATLLRVKKEGDLPDEGDLECLVQLLTTIGSSQDPTKKKFMREDMTQTFEQIRALAVNRALPARMRFMLQDLLDLRANNWVARRKEAEPTTIAQLHQQAEKDDKAKDAASRAALRGSTATPPPPRDLPPPSPSPPIRAASRSPAPKGDSRPARDEDGWETAKRGKGKDEWSQPTRGGRGGDRGGRGSDRGGRGGRGGQSGRNEAPAAQRGGRDDRGGRGGGRGGKGEKDARDNKGGKPEAAPQSGNKFALAAKASAEMPSTSAPPAPAASRKDDSKAAAVLAPTPSAPPRGAAASPALADADFEAKFEQLLEEYLSSHDPDEASTCLKELGADYAHPQFIQKAVLSVLEKKDSDRDLIAVLLYSLHNSKVVTREQFGAGFSLVVDQLEDIEIDIPFASKFVAFFIGNALADSCIVADWFKAGLASVVDTGKALKIAADALLAFVKKRSDAALRELQASTPIDLLALSKADKRSKPALAEFLKDKEPLGSIFA